MDQLKELMVNAIQEVKKTNLLIAEAIETLGGSGNDDILEGVKENVEKTLILSMGGTIGNWVFIDSDILSIFYHFYKDQVDIDELLAYIQQVIDDGCEGEVEISIHKA